MRYASTVSLVLLSILAAGASKAADLAVILPPGVIYSPDPVSSWDGFYIGGQLGWGGGTADHQPVVPPPGFPNGYDVPIGGGLVGAQIGGWWHVTDSIVAGVQLDADWANIGGSLVTGGAPGTITYTINWLATAEGRLGFDAGRFLPYVSLGVAAAGGTRSSTNGGLTSSAVHGGLSIGAGVQFMVTDQISADLEYRYQAFRAASYPTGGTPPSIAPNVSTIRAGINFHF